MPTPPPSPLTSLSPPSARERLARYEVGESSTARPTRGRGVAYGFVSTLDAEERRRGSREVGVTELAELHEHDTQDLYALLKDAQDNLGTSDTTTAVGYSYSDTAPEIPRVMRDIRREISDMQAELLALRWQQRARQPGPDARILDDQDASRDADSHI
ncbi:hypothetical protein Tco_1031512 [Tanacetum coccineum]|uniref:Uncharacterized protein n=1 Tax=Tanacetum coccineum TaxID=301880 RepID=A0ABQ5G976_9ASTR